MEFQVDNPGHLVFDLSATAITLWEVQKKGALFEKVRLKAVCCSECKMKVEIENADRKCAGCQLKLSNIDNVRKSIEQHKRQRLQNKPVERDPITLESTSQADHDYSNQDKPVEMDTSDSDEAIFVQVDYDSEQEADSSSLDAQTARDINSLKLLDLYKFFAPVERFRSKKDDCGTFLELQRRGSICCGCQIIFPSYAELRAHARRVHKDPIEKDAPNSCKICFENFATKVALNNHTRPLTQKFYQYCTACELLLDVRSEFQHKVKKHMTEQEIANALVMVTNKTKTVYRCCVPKCGVSFALEESLLTHQNKDHPRRAETLTLSNTCQICRSTFDSEAAFLKHCNRKQEQPGYGCRVHYCTFQNALKEAAIWHSHQGQHVTEFLKIPNPETVNSSEYWKRINRPKPAEPKPAPTKPLIRKTARKLTSSDRKHFVFRKMESKNVEILELQSEFCCGCFSLFELEEDLRKHVVEAHPKVVDDNNDNFYCEKCNKRFKSAAAVENHHRLRSSRIFYYCQPCRKFCFYKGKLNAHKAVCPSNKEEEGEGGDCASVYYDVVQDDCFICCGCDAKIDTEEELLEHRELEHPGGDPEGGEKRTCSSCYRFFLDGAQLVEHVEAYAKRTSFKCKVPLCVFETKFLTTMKHHAFRGTHESALGEPFNLEGYNPSEFQCCWWNCDFKVASYDELIQHGSDQHGPRQLVNKLKYHHLQLPFPCPVCGKTFKLDHNLLVHQHTRTKRCEKCRKFVRHDSIEHHISNCNYSRKQVQPNTTERKSYKRYEEHKTVCTICGKSYNKKGIVDHMNIHENKRIWKCELCPIAFNTQIIRDNHVLRVHSTEKAYPCRQGCENRYKNPGDRVRHEKMVHLGFKGFACMDCGKSFPRDRELRLHRRIHTGHKLYTCSGCRAEYDKWSEFEQHRSECDALFL